MRWGKFRQAVSTINYSTSVGTRMSEAAMPPQAPAVYIKLEKQSLIQKRSLQCQILSIRVEQRHKGFPLKTRKQNVLINVDDKPVLHIMWNYKKNNPRKHASKCFWGLDDVMNKHPEADNITISAFENLQTSNNKLNHLLKPLNHHIPIEKT